MGRRLLLWQNLPLPSSAGRLVREAVLFCPGSPQGSFRDAMKGESTKMSVDYSERSRQSHFADLENDEVIDIDLALSSLVANGS